MSFQRSLKAGNVGQKIVTDLLDKAGFCVTIAEGRCVEFDGQISGPFDAHFEIKFDLYAKKSGNVAIETRNSKSNTPSGIYGTSADLWFHVFDVPQEVWVTSVKRLRQYCETVTPHKIVFAAGDDNADLLLYRKDVISSIFVNLNQIEQGNIIECLRGLIDYNNGQKNSEVCPD